MESGGAGLASELMENGYKNVKNVSGGGETMEKFFDHYRGGKLVRPLGGQEIKSKP